MSRRAQAHAATRQRDTALSFDRRILGATRGYLDSEAQEALL